MERTVAPLSHLHIAAFLSIQAYSSGPIGEEAEDTPGPSGMTFSAPFVTTPASVSSPEEMSALFGRILLEADPMASECAYLMGDEIRKCLQWPEMECTEEEKEYLFALCKKFRDISASPDNAGKLEIVQHSIDTGEAAPVKFRPYWLSPEKRAVIRDAVAKMLEKGVIEPASCVQPASLWSFPIILVAKKKGEYRFCTLYPL